MFRKELLILIRDCGRSDAELAQIEAQKHKVKLIRDEDVQTLYDAWKQDREGTIAKMYRAAADKVKYFTADLNPTLKVVNGRLL